MDAASDHGSDVRPSGAFWAKLGFQMSLPVAGNASGPSKGVLQILGSLYVIVIVPYFKYL